MTLTDLPGDVYDEMSKYMTNDTLFKFVTVSKKITVNNMILKKRKWLSKPMRHWAAEGCLKAVKYLIEENISKDDAIKFAAAKGNLDVVKYLVSIGEKVNNLTVVPAIDNGHLNIVKFLCEGLKASQKSQKSQTSQTSQASQINRMGLLYYASTTGSLKVVEYLYSIGEEPSEWMVEKACQNGHLDIVKFFHSIGKVTPGATFIDMACSSGHIHIVEFLHSISCGFTSNAICWASGGGFLDLVKYLVSIGAVPSNEAINLAADNGRVQVVIYLHSLGARCRAPYGIESKIEILALLR